MKKLIIILIIIVFSITTLVSQVSLTFRFSNPQIIPGSPGLFQFDVETRADIVGSYMRDLQVYINYNPMAFGNEVAGNSKVNVVPLELMDNHYQLINVVDNTETRLAIIIEAIHEMEVPGSQAYFNPMPDSFTGLLRLQFEIADENQTADINFETSLMSSGQYMQDLTLPNPVSYLIPSIFENNLNNIALKNHIIGLTAGWSGISSYLIPYDAGIENLMQPITNEIIILQNFTGVYWPAGNINTIGNWDENSGYSVKVSGDCQITVFGSKNSNNTLTLSQGWNLIPVISSSEENTIDLFSGVLPELIIVKEVAGAEIYWPAFGICTIPYLIPGKAYFVKTAAASTINFSD